MSFKNFYFSDFFAKDRRFLNAIWNQDSFFCAIKEQYFIFQEQTLQCISQLPISTKEKKRIFFWTKFLFDAYSPSNFPFTNPEVLQKTILQKGENFLAGIRNFLNDVLVTPGLFPPLTNTQPFKLGENIATTKGGVVFQNDLFQLIQYNPTKKYTHKAPILLIPAWINKYYLFDLSNEKSFVKFNLEQGRTVFVLSWVNPKNSKFTLENYLNLGIKTAIDAVCSINKKYLNTLSTVPVNIVSMCVSGTFLLMKLAELAATESLAQVGSVTLLMSPFNFKYLEWMQLFISKDMLNCFKKQLDSTKDSVLIGTVLTKIFCCLRANDLIWPNYVERYLLGNELPTIDFLYWNHDSPRISLQLLYNYLEDVYFKNLFFSKKKDKKTIFFRKNLKKIKNPFFIFGTEKDHLVPWRSCYSAAQHLENAKFVLGGAGHVVGCMNSPSSEKYHYYENCEQNVSANLSSKEWFKSTKKKPGSWWVSWNDWQKQFDLEEIPAFANFPYFEAAPGSYCQAP
ncbi:MAG: alpha/beta fold hydrolase [Holosporales bacterium]|jgi:polyhydroxyalkanoate synthase|nr:alpha/beta fold hydrolase [Holosporales bacterium]